MTSQLFAFLKDKKVFSGCQAQLSHVWHLSEVRVVSFKRMYTYFIIMGRLAVKHPFLE